MGSEIGGEIATKLATLGTLGKLDSRPPTPTPPEDIWTQKFEFVLLSLV